MTAQLSLTEFLELARQHKKVIVHQEIAADRLTPVGIVQALEDKMHEGAILESGLSHGEEGRYSFIAFDPRATLSVENGKVAERVGELTQYYEGDVLTILHERQIALYAVASADQKNLLTAAIGFVTYDAVRLFENIPNRHADQKTLPEMFFRFYETTLLFDHQNHRLTIYTIAEIGNDLKQAYDAAQKKINSLIERIQKGSLINDLKNSVDHQQAPEFQVDIDDGTFMDKVECAKQYIRAGDIFQVVLSRSFSLPMTAKSLDIYRALRIKSPAPYMFYIAINDHVLMGASPERLLRVQDGVMDVHPIAGTRACHQASDRAAIETSLLNDKKELAEHMMLVDLARNDLGSVCEVGSVQVQECAKVKHFSHVSHITSRVTGKLLPEKNALHALAAVFPAGTLTGAPKIRAMQIIDELEDNQRGMYGGAICRLDYQGNLDSCIAIRMAVLKDHIATVRAGAGIVFDSDPLTEANETRQKATGILEALLLAEAGLR
jgi:anthranilate synthase component 1